HQFRFRQPLFHRSDTTLDCTAVTVAFRDHPLKHYDVRV
ncbi:hypothetical protein D021_2700B, partial [Vibrio parahaemolyticus 10296]